MQAARLLFTGCDYFLTRATRSTIAGEFIKVLSVPFDLVGNHAIICSQAL
jgi:hypothetical protein